LFLISAAHTGCFIHRERIYSTHHVGGWLGLRVVVDVLENSVFLALAYNQTVGCPALSPVTAALYELFPHTQPSYKFYFGISIEIKKMTGKEY